MVETAASRVGDNAPTPRPSNKTIIHPLKELSNEQLEGAIVQVYNAYISYGTTYSSTDMVFPKSQKERQKEQKEREREEIKTRKL